MCKLNIDLTYYSKTDFVTSLYNDTFYYTIFHGFHAQGAFDVDVE